MNVAVVGLGLIGGSICKTLRKNTNHSIRGIETDEAALREALSQEAIHSAITPEELSGADVTFLCLYPEATIDFVRAHADCFAKGSIVVDVCGVKQAVVSAVSPLLRERGVIFIGGHPMAGREFSGFAYSTAELFRNASFILTPEPDTEQHAIFVVEMLAEQLGFGQIVRTTPKEHDRIIAFTSQLAHIVSNAYVKSPSLLMQKGFSAGSFQDLTRVAKLNEGMWTSLFLLNKEALLAELSTLEQHLDQYRQALEQEDGERLRELLRDGRLLKEESLKQK